MYGKTHVCAIDGYSGRIMAFSTMPTVYSVNVLAIIMQLLLNCKDFSGRLSENMDYGIS